jgi:transcriptional regulator with XRE-family HTH domain
MGFAEKLNRRLVELGWNDTRLAKEAGASKSAVGKWTNGESLPRVDFAYKVAKAVGLPIDYLVDDEMAEVPEEPPPRIEGLSREDAILLKIAKRVGEDRLIEFLKPIPYPDFPQSPEGES